MTAIERREQLLARLRTPEARDAFREAVALQLKLWEVFRTLENHAGTDFDNLDFVTANAAVGVANIEALTDEWIDECLATVEEDGE